MMDDRELKTVLFCTGFFGLGAVAIILYQHALHTGQIMAAMGAGGTAATPAPMPAATVVSYASRAGMPVIGQDTTPVAKDELAPVQMGRDWSVN